MRTPPSGTLTFLFTDIEGSTRLWERSPRVMPVALERHDEILRSAMDDAAGYVFATGGDGFAVAFARATDALTAANEAQARLGAQIWPEEVRIRVRMGLHTGEATERGGDYFGPAVNRAARLMSTAHGGQVVCSRSTADLAEPSFALRSLGEHRLRDLAAAESVFQVGEGTHPPLRSVDAVPTNLPTMRTELIGRSEQVETLAGLTARERLITLTGVGGVGKTRLALAVAAAIAPGYEDGCWLVDLAPVADGVEIPMTVAAAVRAPVTQPDALVEFLADRRMVIVFDNCEHVIGAVADFTDALIAQAAEVRVIATSREPLGLDGEVVRRVDSLVVPNADVNSVEALDSPAVRLFVERAVAASDRFEFDDALAAAVVEICRRLDGIPLAIELAAARVRSMPPAEIARRLDERFRLLGGGSRRAHERHRTLLATVSWSYDLLSPTEKQVFRRLAVFPASFGLDAAEQIAGSDGSDAEVATSVLSLVDRSLVQFDPSQGRYRLLETLRQYAADLLGESGETARTRELHALYYLTLAESLEAPLNDDRYIEAMKVLLIDIDNLRATATWCVDQDRWTELAAFCERTLFFAIQKATVDGAAWRQQILDHRASLDGQIIVDALGQLAYLQVIGLGDPVAGEQSAQQSVAVADETGAVHSAWAGVALSFSAMLTGRSSDAVAEAEKALALADAAGDPATAVIALDNASAALAGLGETEKSADLCAEALRRAEASRHPLHIGSALITSSANYVTQVADPDFPASESILQRSIGLDVGGTNGMWLDMLWGWTLLGLGKPGAAEYLARSAREADQLAAPHLSDLVLRLLALVFVDHGYLS